MMIYRNTQDNQLYYLYKVKRTGICRGGYQREHMITHAVSWVRDNQLKHYVASYTR